MQPLLRYSLLCMSFFLFSTFFLARRLPEGEHTFPFPRTTSNSEHRIAIILPYTAAATSEEGSDNVASVLPYFPAFCTGAAGAADIADFLIFHTGILNEWPLLTSKCPDNVKFIDLGSHAGLAERLLRVVNHKGETMVMSKPELLELVASYIKVNPYGLVEFKPALGYIFQDYLHDYTHWGYSDIDILFGDLGRWITPDELTDFDIVTYTFGDQQRLYLRGQFTFHKNAPATTNQLWRKCDYLSNMDVRFQKLVDQSKKYHVESAEGCYSAAVLDQNDIAVKFAVKAWTDIYTADTAYSHGVFLSRSHSTGRQVLYKASEENIEESGRQISRLQPGWFEEDRIYKNRKNLIQREVGTRKHVEYEPDPEANCMYWALQKYQSKLCVKDGIYKDETVFWINGKLYKQHYENAALETPIKTAPFFHFQEWKRSYRFGQLSSLYPSSPIQTFVLVPEGAIPMIDGKRTASVPSPLGLSPMKAWNGVNDRSQLPDNTYCLVSAVDGSGQRAKCIKAVSWHNADQTTILTGTPTWVNVDIESDVTLVLTLQISASQATNQRALHNIIDHVAVSLNRWHGQPCVVVISVSGATDEASNYLKEQLGAANTAAVSYSSLIAVVYEKSPTEVSRKALMNMAIDAVPTRWYVSGLELERGLSISVDAAFFAHRAAASHGRLRGNIFILPQFGLADFDTGKTSSRKEGGNSEETDIVISLNDLIDARKKGKCRNLSEFDEACGNNDMSEALDRLGHVESLWWGETHMIADPKQKKEGSVVGEMSRRAAALKNVEHAILELATSDNQRHMMYALDESPLLLTDNLGPHDGIRTNEIAREVETFAGLRCFNSLRLSQLSILGYTFNVLEGAFAASSEASRKAAHSGAIDKLLARCDGCTMFKKDKYDVLNAIARGEIERAAKTSILWAESMGLKQ